MLPRPPSDLSSLAALAQTRDGGLRPALLRAQTELFLAGPRDPAAMAIYEALALGLIPLVDAEVLGEMAALLADVPEAPIPVLAALLSALGGQSASEPDADSRDTDLALARNHGRVLDGRRLDALIERARDDGDLAAALLARPEPGLFQRAALYRFAPERERAALRDELGRRLAPGTTPRFALALAPDMRPALATAPDAGALARMLARYGIGPSRAAAEAGLVGHVAEQELFALALVSLGLDPEQCTRLFLTLDPAISHSVERVLHLARLVRATPPHVATYLAASDAAFAGALPGRGDAIDPAAQRLARPGPDLRRAAPARGSASLRGIGRGA